MSNSLLLMLLLLLLLQDVSVCVHNATRTVTVTAVHLWLNEAHAYYPRSQEQERNGMAALFRPNLRNVMEVCGSITHVLSR